MDKAKCKNSEGKVYKPEGARYWVTVLMIFYLMLISSAMQGWIFTCFLLPFLGLMLYALFVQAAQTSITLYEDGLEYRQGKSRMFVEWQDMSHLGRRGQGESSSYGIYLYRKIQPESSNHVDKLFFGSSSNYVTLSKIVKVPWTGNILWGSTEVDLDKFAQTEFGSDLKYYAPHLFEKGKI